MGLKLEREGRAAVLTFDWTEQRNALGPDECREITTALSEIASDREVHGVVITGNGAFCAGGFICLGGQLGNWD